MIFSRPCTWLKWPPGEERMYLLIYCVAMVFFKLTFFDHAALVPQVTLLPNFPGDFNCMPNWLLNSTCAFLTYLKSTYCRRWLVSDWMWKLRQHKVFEMQCSRKCNLSVSDVVDHVNERLGQVGSTIESWLIVYS